MDSLASCRLPSSGRDTPGSRPGVISGLVGKRWMWNAVSPAPTLGDSENITDSFEFLDCRIGQQGLHLCNGCLVENFQPA